MRDQHPTLGLSLPRQTIKDEILLWEIWSKSLSDLSYMSTVSQF